MASSATASWSGPITTASAAEFSFGAAPRTCARSDWPATRCRTFGVADRMRVPSPAASTMVRVVLPVIRIPCRSWPIVCRRRHKAFLAGMETGITPDKTPGIRMTAHFLLMFASDSVGTLGGRNRLMARDSRNLSDSFEGENTGGFISGLLAEEDELDRRALWRLGSWGVATVGAVIVAMLASQSSIGMRREQIASADLVRQSQQIQTVAKESQSEARRLASAIDTLNSDRDRLYSRVGVLEQGLDSVTGALARQNAAASSPQAAAAPATSAAPVAAAPAEVQRQPPAPAISPVATTAPVP